MTPADVTSRPAVIGTLSIAHLLLLASAGASEVVPEPIEPRAELLLSVEDAELGPGERLKLRGRMENVGGGTLTVLLPIDACDVGRRPVRYEWHVSRLDGAPVPPQRYARCGNMNPIVRGDFAVLEEGEHVTVPVNPESSFLSSPEAFHDLSAPGTYRVQLTYSFTRPQEVHPPGPFGGGVREDARELLRQADPLVVTSNAVTFRRLE